MNEQQLSNSKNVVFTPDSESLGGWEYPTMNHHCLDWFLVSTDVKDNGIGTNASLAHPENWQGYWTENDNPMFKPTIRWVNGNTVNDLYVLRNNKTSVMLTEDFMDLTGLNVDMHKGGMVASKRISRLIRRYSAYGYFPKEEIKVKYMEQTDDEMKVWDGAGLISRKMLNRLTEHVPIGLSKASYKKVMWELRNAKRVEFTLQGIGMNGNGGQDKGHCIVAEDLGEYDFVLPRDTKREVTMNSGEAFVGISFVHGTDDMRLDLQSIINLYPFFDVDYMMDCLKEESKVFIEGVKSGEIDAALSRIDKIESIDQLGDWYLMRYFASGGSAMWFASIVRSLIGQHLKRINYTNLKKFRMPINGGRYYVMPIGVGNAAGVEKTVNEGECLIDKEYGTIWVNDEDWVDHIADVLGGADNDDGCWIHQFVDTDGEQKVLYWRSPNQVGEYIVAKPADDCHTIEFKTMGGATSWREADSSVLPVRIDKVGNIDYLNLVTDGVGDLGQGDDYSVEIMSNTIERQLTNGAGLGTYCNMLMVSQAVWNRLPKQPPAPLEDVIDASVKTGADLSGVIDWCKSAKDSIISGKFAVPVALHERVSKSPYDHIVPSKGHWLDTLVENLKAHIEDVELRREELAATVTPPAEALLKGAEWEDMGIQLRNIYANNRKMMYGKWQFDVEGARLACEEYLMQFAMQTQQHIMLGLLYTVYTGEMSDSSTDSAAWQLGHIAEMTMDALRGLGVLNYIEDTEDGIFSYQVKSNVKLAIPVHVNAVWYNLYRMMTGDKAKMGDIPAKVRNDYKSLVHRMTIAGKFENRAFTVESRGERKVIVNEKGVLVGYVAKGDEDRIGANALSGMKVASDGDGNLCIVIAA